MDVSESRIERIRWSSSDDDRWYVKRLFDKPATYRRWTSSHLDLMRSVAAHSTPQGQIAGLRKARFALLQRQALFQYLRESQVKGRDREIVVSAFHASTDFSKAIVVEHSRFLRSNSSLLCATYLGSALMDDARFHAELEPYSSGYTEFFSLFCDWIIADSHGREYPLRPMLAEMKRNLSQLQARLMAMPIAADRRRFSRLGWH